MSARGLGGGGNHPEKQTSSTTLGNVIVRGLVNTTLRNKLDDTWR